MKVFALFLAVFATLAARVVAQVSVEVTFDQGQFLASERMLAAVRIANFSGRTVTLGKDDEWLDFSVEAEDSGIVRQLEPVPVRGEFEIPNSGRATRWVDLASCFDIGKPGRYRVTAFVKIADLEIDVTSASAGVNVVRGTTVWEQTFGVPVKAGSPPGPVEVRRYEHVQATQDKTVQMYVRISDLNGTKIFKVFALGPLLTFSRPEGRVDRQGNLHALFQVSARMFTYNVIGPSGEHLIRQTHQYTSSRPKLAADPDSAIVVVGGYRIVNETDIPPPPPEDLEDIGNDPAEGKASTNETGTAGAAVTPPGKEVPKPAPAATPAPAVPFEAKPGP